MYPTTDPLLFDGDNEAAANTLPARDAAGALPEAAAAAAVRSVASSSAVGKRPDRPLWRAHVAQRCITPSSSRRSTKNADSGCIFWQRRHCFVTPGRGRSTLSRSAMAALHSGVAAPPRRDGMCFLTFCGRRLGGRAAARARAPPKAASGADAAVDARYGGGVGARCVTMRWPAAVTATSGARDFDAGFVVTGAFTAAAWRCSIKTAHYHCQHATKQKPGT